MTAFSPARVFDAVIVGSGATGGWAAKALTEAGLDVAVLEAGSRLSEEAMNRRFLPNCDLPLRGRAAPASEQALRPIAMKAGILAERNCHLFVNESENPYTTPADRPYYWVRGRQAGGKSLTWARGCYRMTDFELGANAQDGFGVPWPISYADLAPYYDEVERFTGISGRNEGNPPHFPDGKHLPPLHYSRGELELKKVAEQKFGRLVSMGRTATLTRDWLGRKGLYTRIPSLRGRQPEAFFSSMVSTLPAAAATGRLTLCPDTVVSHLTRVPGEPRKVRGAWCVDARDPGKHFEVRGRLVFLCASALESTRILLNSRTRDEPEGIGNGSGVLGRYLSDHVIGVGGSGFLPRLDGVEDAPNATSRVLGAYMPRFRNLGRVEPALGYLRGFQFHVWASQELQDASLGHAGFGAGFKERIGTGRKPWRISFSGIGEMLPRAENRCSLDPVVVDRWGIPALHIDARMSENEARMAKDIADTAEEMMRALGAEEIRRGEVPKPPGYAIHETGTARMGSDPRTSYLNAWNQSHEVPSLFVTDGASMTSGGHQNPTLTMMALTLRACGRAVRELRSGEL